MDEQELKQEVMTIDEAVKAIVVNDAETYQSAGGMIINLDNLIKKIKTYWKEPKEKAFQAHKAITAKEAEMLKPIEERRRFLNGKISAYLTEQERIRKAEQARLDEERRKAEQKEREKLQARAEKAEEKGNDAKAEALRQKAEDVFIPPAIVVPAVEKTTKMDTGTISAVKDIEIEIVSELEIIRGIAEKQIPISVVTIHEAKLKAHIKAFQIKEMRGVKIIEVVKSKFRGK